jgi:hypothetical protein
MTLHEVDAGLADQLRVLDPHEPFLSSARPQFVARNQESSVAIRDGSSRDRDFELITGL